MATSTEIGIIRFIPIHMQKVWGGRRLTEVFGRDLPEGPVGESWEVSGLREQLSRVAEGPFLGADIYRLADIHGEEILGPACEESCRHDFPLLVKFIDASDVLSVQVHPNDEQARRIGLANGKSEAWVVVAASEGAAVYRGFREGVDRETFRRAIESGSTAEVEACIVRVPVKAGDVIDLPAGTVHAIGPGLLLCEVQQSSDVTYRVFDWNRLGLDGKPRDLHVEEAMAVLDFSPGEASSGQAAQEVSGGVARTIHRDAYPFHLETARAEAFGRVETPGDRFEIVSFVDGAGAVVSPEGQKSPVSAGVSALVPASWPGYSVEPEAGKGLSWVRTWVM